MTRNSYTVAEIIESFKEYYDTADVMVVIYDEQVKYCDDITEADEVLTEAYTDKVFVEDVNEANGIIYVSVSPA